MGERQMLCPRLGLPGLGLWANGNLGSIPSVHMNCDAAAATQQVSCELNNGCYQTIGSSLFL